MENLGQVNQETEKQTLEKGDLFYTSWGYDQTNYDYLVVLSVSETGKTAKCRMTGALNMGSEGTSDVQEPIFCPYGDVFTMQIKKPDYNENVKGRIFLRGSYPFCNDGSMKNKRLDSFSRVTPGKLYFPTNSMYGH